jgi:hypothetical protein
MRKRHVNKNPQPDGYVLTFSNIPDLEDYLVCKVPQGLSSSG